MKPARSYRAAGARFEMQFNVGQEALRKLMSAGAIDEAEVRKLAKDHRIPANAADVQALSFAVNAMRVTKPADHMLDMIAAGHREKYTALAGRIADKIAALEDDLDKLLADDPAGEGFIRVRVDGGAPGVIDVDTARLARFRVEADRTMHYLRASSARALPKSFRKKTLHGDIMCLARTLEQAARRAGTKLDFGSATSRAVQLIEVLLIRAQVIRKSGKDSNRGMICKAILRYRAALKELENDQAN